MKKLILILLALLILPITFSLEECKGTITEDKVPCLVFLPVNTSSRNCTTIEVAYFSNDTNLYNQTMDTFNHFTCNSTFNQSNFGTYTFSYSTGDSGSIVVEEGNMNFFNMFVYAIFTAIVFVLIGFMHKFREEGNVSIVYGWLATAISCILGAIVLSPNFDVIRGVVFFIDVDFYLATISFIIAMYTAIVSMNLKRGYRQPAKGDYEW